MDITQAAELIQSFENGSLSKRVSRIERELVEKKLDQVNKSLIDLSISPDILDAALTFKRAAGQINVIIHTLGIILSLPYILEENEVVQALSLGAGNTGKPFDLETNLRVAEFKFIKWQGGPEAIRQNQLFKDLFYLAEYSGEKKRSLYILGDKVPIKFFEGSRSLTSVLSKNKKVETDFRGLYSDRFSRVYEYFHFRREKIEIVDLLKVLPGEIAELFIKS